ncbi:NAD(P)H-dependent oxidoreductase [uncultured Roseovarius sp.]|uniref:NAD(P)H-dependent oxidoreductase n=1 Tax=uncultured Roseovarius sp. TaxID=293344 RepID=UPI00262DBCFA|nr:NAD(P)H-dependent oxidoreductase [uncultured Roseovarius sp.]
MTRKVFIWVAHPRATSFCSALADAYEAGASEAGATIRRMDLNAMRFDPHFEGYGPDMPALEPDLAEWQENIAWADHLLIVHPYWWGAMPARAKAVLDRALTSGFGFKYHRRGMGWDKLLTGRTADAILTSDTPTLIDTLLYLKPPRRVIRNQVLKFCGIRPRKVVQFGSVKLSDATKRTRWIERARDMGRTAA